MPYAVKGGAPAPAPGGPVKKKRIWWRILLAWFGGFIAFPLVLAGVVAIVGTCVATRDVIYMFGGNPDEVIGESYQSKTILQTVMDLTDGITNNKFDTLGSLNEVSPKVRTTVEDVYKTLANSLLNDGSDVALDWEAIKDKKFTAGEGDNKESPVATELKRQLFNNIPISKLFDNIETDENSKILNYILYPVKMVPKVDEHGEPVLDGEGNPVMVRDGFDTENPYCLADLLEGKEFFTNLTETIVIGDIVPNEDGNKLIEKMSDWHLDEISSNLNDLTVDDFLGTTDSMMSDLFGNKTLNELKTLSTKDIVLVDVFGEEIMDPASPKYNRVIAAMIEKIGKDENGKYKATVDDLSKESSINDLKVSEIMDASKFTGVGKNLLDALDEKNATFGNMGETIGEITMGEFFGISKDATSYDEVKDDDIPYVMWSLRETPFDDVKDEHGNIIKKGLSKKMDELLVKEAIEIHENNEYEGPLAAGSKAVAEAKYYSRTGAGTELDPYVYTLEARAVGADVAGLYRLVHEKSNSVLISIKDCQFGDGDSIVDSLKNGDVKLKDVIVINDDSSKLMKNLGNTSLGDLDGKIKTMTLGEMIDVYDNNVYSDEPLPTGSHAEDGVRYFDLIGTEYIEDTSINVGDNVAGKYELLHEKSHPILLALEGVTVLSDNGLQNKFKTLKFSEVFTEEDCAGSNVLEALWKNNNNGDFVITDIADAMENVMIVDLLGDDLYETVEYKQASGTAKEGFRYFSKVGDVYTEELGISVGDDVTGLYYSNYRKTETVVDGFIYRIGHTPTEDGENALRKIKLTWWFLLTEEGETFNAQEERYVLKKAIQKDGTGKPYYGVSAMNQLVENITNHMQVECLYDLHDAGFLGDSPRSNLDVIIGTKAIGEMTISELIAALQP